MPAPQPKRRIPSTPRLAFAGCLQVPVLPRALGILLMLGGFGYLADVVATYASSGLQSSVGTVLAFPAGLTEIAFALWLLIKGAKVQRSDEEAAVAVSVSAA